MAGAIGTLLGSKIPGVDAIKGMAEKIPGVDAIKGVTGKITGAASKILPTANQTGSTTSKGDTIVKGFFQKGIKLPWWAHIFLAGGLPAGPLIPWIGPLLFSFLYTFGSNGMNLLVSNSMGWAAAKAATNLIFQNMGHFISTVYTNHWWAPYVKNFLYYANPWFVFDLLQINNPDFVKQGYKLPFLNLQTDSRLKAPIDMTRITNKTIGFPDPNHTGAGTSYGLLSAVPIGAALVLIMPALTLMTANLPPEIQSQITPTVDRIFSIIGTLSGIAGGGIGLTGLMTMAPQVMASMSGGGEAAPPVVTAQTGGSISVPSIDDIAKTMLQRGGGVDSESSFFIGMLAFVVFGGVTLSVVRSNEA